jgi:hypothetical protein
MPSRVRLYTGQRLGAPDLACAVAAELRSQELHVVGAHAAWGIALGFEISAPEPGTLRVDPGVAYDAWGRTLVVAAATLFDAPDADAIVVATWADCAAVVRLRDSADVRLGRDVPLAALDAKGAFGLDVRRAARTRAAPRIAAGTFTADLELSGADSSGVGIDTRAGGFVETPSYVVIVAGVDPEPSHWGPLVSVSDPAPDSFTAVVRRPPRVASDGATQPLSLTLNWIGVEPRHGCPLPRQFLFLSDLEEALP